MTDSGWVTQREAAELLGVHPSAVPKMIARGDLSPRRQRPSLSRGQVLELVAARERRAARATSWVGPRPPDWDHDWLRAEAAAVVLGCTVSALKERARVGTVPSTVHRRRRWYRFDLLELQVRALAARHRALG